MNDLKSTSTLCELGIKDLEVNFRLSMGVLLTNIPLRVWLVFGYYVTKYLVPFLSPDKK